CTNAYHPVDQSGWTKTFAATYEGELTEAVEEGMGVGTTPWGDEAYVYRDAIDGDGSGYDSIVYVSCGDEGSMFMLGWETDYSESLLDFGDTGWLDDIFGDLEDKFGTTVHVTATHDSPREYLPPDFAAGSVGTWDYVYTITMLQEDTGGSVDSSSAAVTGTYVEAGTESLTLFDGTTVEAYKLTNSFEIETSGSTGLETTDGYIEQWWVKGLGLVREYFKDQDTGAYLLTKELSSYSGLEIEE
ncbi:MAG: hypothetical protein QGG40_06910, partial [Myxococcota bacterium]|nr:hypothetical protein [Myxococcota bacterium]